MENWTLWNWATTITLAVVPVAWFVVRIYVSGELMRLREEVQVDAERRYMAKELLNEKLEALIRAVQRLESKVDKRDDHEVDTLAKAVAKEMRRDP